MILFPYAKINLGLDILRKRPDGYHDISTLFLPTTWSDILEILPAPEGEGTSLTVSGRPVDCPPEKNLVMKAYNALAAVASLPPATMLLRKIIPDGAGLGGGSADAAFTLVGLNKVFSLGLPDSRLEEIAAGVGADCPYFIRGGAAMASGTGTDLVSVDFRLPEQFRTLVIVKPRAEMSTKEAYAGVVPAAPASSLSDRLRLPAEKWQKAIVNDFEKSVFAALPEVGAIKDTLLGMGALYASMSGSGTSVYAFFPGDILADDLSRRFPDCDLHIETVSH